MALVQSTSYEFDQLAQRRDFLARIFRPPETSEDETHSDSCSDSEFDDDQGCEWRWHSSSGPSTALKHEGREVVFHPDYSCGTAATKGEEPLFDGGVHYWEVKMTSAVYGTDMMVGVGTKDTDLERYRSSFCSILGRDQDSWGLSYFGTFHHDGLTHDYTTKFDRGTTIGIHVDTWSGRLTFLRDDQPLGVAAEGLKGKELYPMVSSTAARTKMRLTRSTSLKHSLQYLCCEAIGKALSHPNNVHDLPLPPGVKKHLAKELNWILKVTAQPKPKEDGVWDSKRKRKC
ncbi:SPRY domain-containing SOCS box protein 3 isoform X2 [Nematostella vectensis]|uniref:SPRY domain-containing SOCS box protein 3 isoform X2 n=1 Tax=Nematostella vectensis TaxID=45351 RepID=UPI00207709EC|nr:SPRY domain-containing SOCS box protein 3 isoform X2 [Nematostella vectensis]